MIDIFVKFCFEKFVKNPVYHFSYKLVDVKGLHAKGFLFFSIFSFLSKNGQNGENVYSSKVVDFFKTIDGSML